MTGSGAGPTLLRVEGVGKTAGRLVIKAASQEWGGGRCFPGSAKRGSGHRFGVNSEGCCFRSGAGFLEPVKTAGWVESKQQCHYTRGGPRPGRGDSKGLRGPRSRPRAQARATGGARTFGGGFWRSGKGPFGGPAPTRGRQRSPGGPRARKKESGRGRAVTVFELAGIRMATGGTPRGRKREGQRRGSVRFEHAPFGETTRCPRGG